MLGSRFEEVYSQSSLLYKNLLETESCNAPQRAKSIETRKEEVFTDVVRQIASELKRAHPRLQLVLGIDPEWP